MRPPRARIDAIAVAMASARSSCPLVTPALVLAAAPDAVADAYQVDEDDVLGRRCPGVLGNDSDPDVATP